MSVVKFTSGCVHVVAEAADGRMASETLADGESILVGSDDQCRLRLPDTSVSPKHCLVRFQNSELTLQDWCSENGTRLNGEPIDGVSVVSPGDRVQLGVYRLTFAGDKPAKPSTTVTPTPRTAKENLEGDSTASAKAYAGSSKSRTEHMQETNATAYDPPSRQQDAPDAVLRDQSARRSMEDALENAVSRDRSARRSMEDALENVVSRDRSARRHTDDALEDNLAAGSAPARESRAPVASPVQHSMAAARTLESPAGATAAPRQSRDSSSVEQSTIDLLKSEIELLQAELSEKDAQLSQLPASKGPVDPDSAASVPELEKRIERLLFELDQSDQRIAALEELLRVAEETQLAEAEQTRQLEAWVDDIEKRIAEREAESQAECDVLRKRLEKAAEERSHLHVQVDQLSRSDGEGRPDPALEEMVQTLRQEVQGLRRENESLSEKVAERDAAYEQQRRRCAELEQQTDGGDAYIEERVNEALRAERLLLAQERAALSRQQLDLTNKVHELTHEVERQNRVHPADDKFRVFREQLKELHEQEKTEQAAPTVSQRLARLWQRLDGPTDRD